MPEFEAYLEDFHTVTVLVEEQQKASLQPPFHLEGEREILPLEITEEKIVGGMARITAVFDGFVLLNHVYYVKDSQGSSAELYSGEIVRTELFDNLYYYDGELGHFYTPESTRFKIWTPVAKSVTLILTQEGRSQRVPLDYINQGLWQVDIQGDLDGAEYYYEAYVNGRTRSFLDPYGVASGANGRCNYVIDPSKLRKVTPYKGPHGCDAVLYEASIRDLTSDSTIHASRPGSYYSAAESGLVTPAGNPAGFDYVKSLPITHIQFMPFYDFEGVDETRPFEAYNWGYNPSQYNVPEGSYASDPDDPYARILELQDMIDTYHKAGVGGVMDVVYNHVYDVETFPFDQLVPGYAFRVNADGYLTDSSGCGNDLATERRMVRKFIVDSVLYWARRYRVAGFRFDLMGLIDINTMHFVRQRLERFDRRIMVHGEGWKMPAPLGESMLTHLQNRHVLFNIGFFNDMTREVVKGSTFTVEDRGYAMGRAGHHGTLTSILRGSTVTSGGIKYPGQSLNYVECHDDHTFADKAALAMADRDESERRRAQRLATAFIVLSQGVPFIHSGQEFYRSKQGVRNSYKSPDAINKLDYSRLDAYAEDVENFRRLLRLRREQPALRLRTPYDIATRTAIEIRKHGTILYTIDNDDGSKLHVIFKNTAKPESLHFDSPFKLLFDSEGTAEIDTGTVTLSTPIALVLATTPR